MEPTPATTPEPSFADVVLSAMATPPAEGTPAPAAPAPAAPATPPVTPGTPPAADAVPNLDWLKEFPGYESPEALRTALGSLDGLRANQLTEDQRTVLALSQDPDKWREFNQLTHLTDPKTLDDEVALYELFKQQHPGETDENLRFLFEEEQDKLYPGLAGQPEDVAYKAHASVRKRAADTARQTLDTTRQARLDELKKGALPNPAAQQQATREAQVAAHLTLVDTALAAHPDGYGFTVNVDGQPLNLKVEAKDMPAFRAVMENPFGALLNEAKDGLDPEKLKAFAAWQLHGPAFLAAAKQAGRTGSGPLLDVAELHNDQGTPSPGAQGGDGSLSQAIGTAFAGATSQPKLRY